MIILNREKLYTLKVYYYLPQSLLIQLFLWQTLDVNPKYPRINRFLDFWHREIDAVIQEVVISENEEKWRHGTVLPLD